MVPFIDQIEGQRTTNEAVAGREDGVQPSLTEHPMAADIMMSYVHCNWIETYAGFNVAAWSFTGTSPYRRDRPVVLRTSTSLGPDPLPSIIGSKHDVSEEPLKGAISVLAQGCQVLPWDWDYVAGTIAAAAIQLPYAASVSQAGCLRKNTCFHCRRHCCSIIQCRWSPPRNQWTES